MGKQIVHDWSTGELVQYEIDADDPIIEQLEAEPTPEPEPTSEPEEETPTE